MKKEKSYWNLKKSWKQEPDRYEIDQFQSISLMEELTSKRFHMGGWEFYTKALRKTLLLKERGMLGPYNTSVFLIVISVSPLLLLLCPIEAYYSLIVISVAPLLLLLCPIKAHYCYCCVLTLLFLCRIWLYCGSLDSYIYQGGILIWIIQYLFIYVM